MRLHVRRSHTLAFSRRMGRWLLLGLIVCAAPGQLLAQAPPSCLPGPNPSGHPLFGTPSLHADPAFFAGTHLLIAATEAAFADFNGDGVLDAVVVGGLGAPTNGGACVCMGLGNGVFAPPTLYTAGSEPCSVDAADLNHDGRPDLAVANAAGDTVSVFLNRGNGTFASPINYAVGHQPRCVRIADVNADGWPDLVVLNCLTNDASVLMNRGDGTFGPEVRIAVGNVTQRGDLNPTFAYPGPFLAVADFNGDHAPDIAVPSPSSIKILVNDGAGHFTLSPTVAPIVSHDAYCIAAADLNRDGKQDLAVAVTGSDDHGLSVLMGRGDGTFAPAVAYDVNPVPNGQFVFTNHVAVGDIDGDGFPDIAMGFEEGHGFVTTLRNRGDGTFCPKVLINSDYRSWYVGLFDLCRRGKCDLALLASTQIYTPLKVHLNDGGGNLLTYAASGTEGRTPGGGALADIDGDGNPDLITTIEYGPEQVYIMPGRGDGTFGAPTALSFPTTNPVSAYRVALADMAGRHQPDLVVSDAASPGGGVTPGNIWIALHESGLSYATPVAYPMGNRTPTSIAVDDFNGDGRPDVAAWTVAPPATVGAPVERSIQVFLNRGDGTLLPPVGYPIDVADQWDTRGDLLAADLDHDGKPDLVASIGVIGVQPSVVVVLHNRGDGTFESWDTVPVSYEPVWMASADFDGDGFDDIAVLISRFAANDPPDKPYLTILYNDHTGHFPTRSDYVDARLSTGYSIVAGDVNGDGKPDILFDHAAMNEIEVLLNCGDGHMGAPVGYGVRGPHAGGWAPALMVADLTHSGRPGILAVQNTGLASFLPNLACPRCYANCDNSTAPPILNAGDFLCFLNRFASADPYANCDGSTLAPVLNVNDFLCFLSRFAGGCP